MPRDGDAEEVRTGARLVRAEERARDIYRTIARGKVVPNEAHVQAALDYLLHSAPLVEEAYLRARQAAREAKATYARVLLAAPSDVCRNKEEREAWAETQGPYQRALEAEIAASAAMKGHYARRETATTIIEAWQTASANIRGIKL